MHTRAAARNAPNHDPLTLGACTWLAGGMVLYGCAPLPLHDPALGWSVAFWLLGAPALVLAFRWALGKRGVWTRTSCSDRRVQWNRQGIRRRQPAIRRRVTPRPLHAAHPAGSRHSEGRIQSTAR